MFVAACLFACGDTRQRWHADRWFHGDRIPLDVLEPFHLDAPLKGTAKILNGLFTLNRLTGSVFCLAFDQMETTFNSQPEREKYRQMLEPLVTILCSVPSFAFLFMFQESHWENFRSFFPALTARIVEGNQGAKPQLQPLNDATAEDLIRCRMNASVWSALPSALPPANQPCFPFTATDVRDTRRDAENDLRYFLQLAKERFDKFLQSGQPPLRRQLLLTSIEPQEVLSHEPTAVLITGQHFPSDVTVLFDTIPASGAVTCRPAEGQIDVTTPQWLLGDVEVRVEAANDPGNYACLTLRFLERPPRTPYRDYIDGQKLKARREELDLTLKDVANKMPKGDLTIRVSTLSVYISLMEREGGKNRASDDLYVRLAAIYEKPLSYFLK